MHYRWLLFDVGDTIVASYPRDGEVYAQKLHSLGVSDADPALLHRAIHEAIGRQVRRENEGASRMDEPARKRLMDRAALEAGYGNVDEALLARLYAMDDPPRRLAVMPGVFEALDALKAKGYPMGIVSNHTPALIGFLKETGLFPYFDPIVISEIEGVAKPDPRIMALALERMGAEAAETLYVGDHPYDVLCAGDAGIDCLWLAEDWAKLPNEVPYAPALRGESLAALVDKL